MIFAIMFLLTLPNREFSVVSTPPIEAKSLETKSAYVIGLDAKIRTCPDDYDVYVRLEGKVKGKDFFKVLQGQTVTATHDQHFTVACLKVLP